MTELGELYAGRTLGRYELLVPIAQGATASVWVARSTGSEPERIVAIKAMLTDLSSEELESMFLDEARLASRIRHPNVAEVLELGSEEDAFFIVIEWVEGEPLQVLLREAKGTRIPLPLTLRIVQQAAAGLHAAHELCDDAGKHLGIVHRDVSPTNLLITYEGMVKVIDFGVAWAASNFQKTSVGQMKGKIPYMAPEQARGDPVDRRTDIFALGVILFQLVCGKHPFRGDSEFATLARIRDDRPADSPKTFVPDLPEALEKAMLKALSKDKTERFADMLAFARALEEAVPPPPDVDKTLGAFVGKLLSSRAAKRDQSVRAALHAANTRTEPPAPPRFLGGPISFGPQSREPVSRVPASERQPAQPPLSARKPAEEEAARSEAKAPLVADRPRRTSTVPNFYGQSRSFGKLFIAGIALLILIALAAWAISGGQPNGEDGAPTKRAF